MQKKIIIDEKNLIAVHDMEDKKSLFFITEETNKKVKLFRKKYKDDRTLYPKEEFINVHPIKEIQNPQPNEMNYEVELNKTIEIPIYRVDYSWGKYGI